MLNAYEKIKSLSKVVALLSFGLLIGTMLLIVTDIGLRYFFHSPMRGTVELVEGLMALIVFASLSYTQTEKGHIQIMLFLKLMPEKLRLLINAFNYLVTTATCAFTTFAVFRQAGYVLRKGLVSAILHIPLYPFYYFAFLCMIVFTLVLVADTLISIVAVFKSEYAEWVQESWV